MSRPDFDAVERWLDAQPPRQGPPCPADCDEDRWKETSAFDHAPLSTSARELKRAGIVLPEPATMDDAALTAKLWEVIRGLAEMNTTLSSTDHLSDRQLYEWLYERGMREVGPVMGGGWHCGLDVLGGCSEEDLETRLRYYADEDERRHWAESFPDDVIPPAEKPPYDRDRHLPRGTIPEWSPDDENAGPAVKSEEDVRS